MLARGACDNPLESVATLGEGTRFVESASVSLVHDPVYMLRILEQHLQPRQEIAYRVRECRIVNTRRRDGSRGAVEYSLRMENPATGRVWDQIVTGVSFGGVRTRRVWDVISLTPGQQEYAADPSAMPPFAYVSELDLLLQVFPHDHRLPAVAGIMSGPLPKLIEPILRELGPGDWQSPEWDAEVVEYRVDMRAIFRLRVRATDAATGHRADRLFYAKVYRDAEEGRRSYEVQRDVHEHVSVGETYLSVAKPIVYSDVPRTLVTAVAPGTSLEMLIRRNQGVPDAVRSVARAVAELHRLNVNAPLRSSNHDLAQLQEAQRVLESVRPDLNGVVSEILETVAVGLKESPTSLIHGDLKPDHLLIDGNRVALIDFDLAAVADPIADIAHLLTYLDKARKRSRSRRENTGDVGQMFIDEYFTHVPASWESRLPLYHAMSSVHKAAGLCRGRSMERSDEAETVLREGQALLAGPGTGMVPSFKRRLTRLSTS